MSRLVKQRLEGVVLTEDILNAVVEWMVETGRNETTEGNWIFTEEDIKAYVPEHFIGNVDSFREAIEEKLNERDELADVECYLDNGQYCYDLNFYLDYCPNADEDEEE